MNFEKSVTKNSFYARTRRLFRQSDEAIFRKIEMDKHFFALCYLSEKLTLCKNCRKRRKLSFYRNITVETQTIHNSVLAKI